MTTTTEAPRRRRDRSRGLRCDCQLLGTIVLDGKRVPPGHCWVRQRHQEVLLCWAAADGGPQQREIGAELLRQLLDEGVLLYRHPSSRLAWRRAKRGATLFCSGLEFALSAKDAARLAAAEEIDGALYGQLSARGREVVLELLAQGHYQRAHDDTHEDIDDEPAPALSVSAAAHGDADDDASDDARDDPDTMDADDAVDDDADVEAVADDADSPEERVAAAEAADDEADTDDEAAPSDTGDDGIPSRA